METRINLGNILSESYTIIVTSCLAYYLLSYKRTQNLSKVIMWLFFIILGIYSVMTFYYSRTQPGIMRSAAMAYNQDIYESYFLRGLAHYQFPHAIACLIPAFVLGLKKGNHPLFTKLLAFGLLGLSLVLVYITQATGALIVAVFALLLAIIARKGNTMKNTITLIIVSIFALPFMVSSDVQSGLLGFVGDLVGPSNSYYSKIVELQSSLSGVEMEEGDISTRGALLEETLDAIIRHPILGVSDRSYGQHNALLDRWAEYGLVGFLPLLLGMFWMISLTLRKIPLHLRTFYFIGVASSFIMMLTKNMFGWDQWFSFLVLLPVLINYFGGTSPQNTSYVSH